MPLWRRAEGSPFWLEGLARGAGEPTANPITVRLQALGSDAAALLAALTVAARPFRAADLGRALGADTINALSQQTGMSQDDLLTGMSRQLPELVDKLTPDGRLPTDEERSTRFMNRVGAK